jgi:hypothetical protein
MTAAQRRAILARAGDMARSIRYFLGALALWICMACTAEGQTAVEAGMGAARAATTTAPAKGIGKSMSGFAGSLDKAVRGGQQGSGRPSEGKAAARTTAETLSTPAKGALPAGPSREDPSGIQTGLSYQELVRRFGPPAMEITSELGTSLTYSGKSGLFQLEVRDGKVVSIEKPGA